MMKQVRDYLIERLNAENCSCVIRSGNETRVFHERGVKDLYRLLKEEPEFLSGAFVADKVVGKAAAALMILGGVKEIFANIISQPACELLEKAARSCGIYATGNAYYQPHANGLVSVGNRMYASGIGRGMPPDY